MSGELTKLDSSAISIFSLGRRRGPKPAKRRKKPISAERRASQKIQGQYLGYISQIAERERPKFQKLAKEDGREKAIAAMKKRLGK